MTQQRVPVVIQRIRAQRAQREAEKLRNIRSLQARGQAARTGSQVATAQGLRTEPLPPFPGGESPFIPPTAPKPEEGGFGFGDIGSAIKFPFAKGLDFLEASAKTGSAAALTAASALAPSSSFGQEFRGELKKARRQGKGLYGSLRQAQEEIELPKFVKGATEFIFDPLNLVPTVFIAKPLSFAARAGLRGVKSGAAFAGAKTLGRAALQKDALGVGEGVVKSLEPTVKGPYLEETFAQNLDEAAEAFRARTGREVDVIAQEAAEQKAIRAEGRAGVLVRMEPMITHDEMYSVPGARLATSELGERIRGGRWIPKKPDITLPVGGAFRWMFDWTNPAIALQQATPLAKIAHLFRTRSEDSLQQVAAGMSYIKSMKIPERLVADEIGIVNIKGVGSIGRPSAGKVGEELFPSRTSTAAPASAAGRAVARAAGGTETVAGTSINRRTDPSFLDPRTATPEELSEAIENAGRSEHQQVVQALGSEDAAKRFERLDKAQNSSDPKRADAATEKLNSEFLDDLTDEQERLIYGNIKDPEITEESLKELMDVGVAITPEDGIPELSRMLARGLSRLTPEKVQAVLSASRGEAAGRLLQDVVQYRRVQASVAAMRELGLNTDQIFQNAVRQLRSEGIEDADIDVLLGPFMRGEGKLSIAPSTGGIDDVIGGVSRTVDPGAAAGTTPAPPAPRIKATRDPRVKAIETSKPLLPSNLEGTNEIVLERVLQSGLDNPGLKALLTPEEVEYIMVAKGTIDGFRRLAVEGGLDMAEWGGLEELFPRYVREIRGIEVSPLGSRAPGAAPVLNNPRIILDSEVEEAVYAGKQKYLGDTNAQIEAFGGIVYKALRDEDLARAVEPFSKGLDPARTKAIRQSIQAGKYEVNELRKLKKDLIAVGGPQGKLKLAARKGESLKTIMAAHGLDDDIDILTAPLPKPLRRAPTPEGPRATRARTATEVLDEGAVDNKARKRALRRIRMEVDSVEAAAVKELRESESKASGIQRLIQKGRGPIDPDKADEALRRDIASGKVPIQALRDDSGRIPPALWAMQFDESELKILEAAINVNRTWFDVTLESTGKAGDIARVMKAGFDFGAPFIQNLPLLATNPEAWARSTNHMFKAFADERVHWDFMAQHMDTVRKLQRYQVPVGTRTTDFVDAIGRGGTLEQIGRKAGGQAAKLENERLDKILAAVGGKASKVFRKFEIGFEAPLDMGRVLQWEALEASVLKSAVRKNIDEETALAGLAQYLRNSTGALSTTTLGIGRSRQALERGFLFFSPRYTRASIALMADAMHGGIEGELARKAIGKMMAGGVMVHNAFAAALDQDPNFDPLKGDFLTLNIGGDHIGPGTIFVQMMRASTRTSEKILEGDLGAFKSLSTRDNPIAGFVRGRGAPGGGVVWDILTGTDYLGEPLERGLSTRTAGHVVSQVAPFALEAALMSSPKRQGAAGTAGGMLGLRTYPLTYSESRSDLRDEIAGRMFGENYSDLNGLQKEKVNNSEGTAGNALRDVIEKARGDSARRGDELDRKVEDFNLERKAINASWNENAAKLEKRFTEYPGHRLLEGLELREQLKLENRIRRERMRDLNNSEDGIEVKEYFDGLRDRLDTDERPEDYAYQIYLSDVLFNEDFIDPDTGEIIYSKRDVAQGQFLDTWGEEVFGYVQARLSEGFEITPYAQELVIQRERFRYYWDASSQAVISSRSDGEYVGKMYEAYTRASRDYKKVLLDESPILKSTVNQIGKVRKSLREKDQELDGFLHRWYGLTLVHPDNQWDAATDHYKKATPVMDSYLP